MTSPYPWDYASITNSQLQAACADLRQWLRAATDRAGWQVGIGTAGVTATLADALVLPTAKSPDDAKVQWRATLERGGHWRREPMAVVGVIV